MTICALSTGIGASGVAIIRISGPETNFLIKSLPLSIVRKTKFESIFFIASINPI